MCYVVNTSLANLSTRFEEVFERFNGFSTQKVRDGFLGYPRTSLTFIKDFALVSRDLHPSHMFEYEHDMSSLDFKHDVMHYVPMHKHMDNKATLLGYVLGSQGFKINEKRVKATQAWPTSKSMRNKMLSVLKCRLDLGDAKANSVLDSRQIIIRLVPTGPNLTWSTPNNQTEYKGEKFRASRESTFHDDRQWKDGSGAPVIVETLRIGSTRVHWLAKWSPLTTFDLPVLDLHLLDRERHLTEASCTIVLAWSPLKSTLAETASPAECFLASAEMFWAKMSPLGRGTPDIQAHKTSLNLFGQSQYGFSWDGTEVGMDSAWRDFYSNEGEKIEKRLKQNAMEHK
ncbi:hypothetical protein CR513_41909, partial [Mucuna pruriens]